MPSAPSRLSRSLGHIRAVSRKSTLTAGFVLAAVLVVGVFMLLAKGPELLLPIGPDQGTYSYLAETILRGGRPYVDAFDNKPPGTYYLHAAALAFVPPGERWEPACLSPATQ